MSSLNSCRAEWNGAPVSVTARAVPRYLWQTVSIDVSVADETVLATGGVMKFTGERKETFQFDDADHVAQLNWGTGSALGFPFTLSIDGAAVLSSRVPIRNWPMMVLPWLLALGLVLIWDFS